MGDEKRFVSKLWTGWTDWLYAVRDEKMATRTRLRIVIDMILGLGLVAAIIGGFVLASRRFRWGGDDFDAHWDLGVIVPLFAVIWIGALRRRKR